METNEQLKRIQEFALEMDWNQAFGGKSQGNRHLFRIVEKAKRLAETVDADLLVVEAGAWLHDTNLGKTISGSTLENEEVVRDFLHRVEIPEEKIVKIIHCIESHDGRVLAQTIEAKIVHDADTLEKMGPLGIVRETWKRSQLGWTTEKIVDHLKTHLYKRESKLYTKAAQEIAAQLNQQLEQFFKVIEQQLKEENEMNNLAELLF